MTPWRTIDTAPKDGTKIYLTWMDDGEPQEEYLMQWDDNATNALFPGIDGFWIMPCGSATWVANGDGAPTHWRPAPEFNN